MNLKSLLTCSLLAIPLAGCWNPQSPENMPGRQAMWVGDSIRAAAINKAIVAQQIIYPYHFVTNTAELNKLGERDLNVLAEYYAKHPGALSIHQAGAAKELYDARVVAVLDRLKAAGVPNERMKVADAFPGGDGIPSERVVQILREPAELTGGSTGSEAGGGDDSSGTGSSMSTSE
ncbi:MAG TPA: hypothetical protein VFD43_04040 [Planctomycetota bacterium]|nr:hypothetical protein [Planctomycetota bacterium]